MTSEKTRVIRQVTLVAIMVIASTLNVFANSNGDREMLDGAKRSAIVDSVLSKVVEKYIIPDTALLMEKHVRAKLAAGDYDEIVDLGQFTAQLTKDLHEIKPDRHLWIFEMEPHDFYPEEGDTLTDAKKAERARQNYGFRKVERLAGNVGYLELQMFDDASYAGEAAAAAMSFLGRSDAVIIDVSCNGGGEESMVQLLCSYFMKEPTLLRDVRHRNKPDWQSWSLPYVSGPTLYDADVYLLISDNTGSAAEAFTSGMKHLRGATLVGEKTRGAAYMCDFYNFPELGVRAKISTGEPIEPSTGSNWERVGIQPDIKCPVHEALERAHLAALEKMAAGAPGDTVAYEIEWAMTGYRAKHDPAELDEAQLGKYVGQYSDIRILLRDGVLYYKWEGIPEARLSPMTENLFGIDGAAYKRIRFNLKDDGAVAGVEVLYDDGYRASRKRTGD